MKIFFIISLLFSFQAYALLDSYIATKPNQAYMQFFLQGYLRWFNQTYQYAPKIKSIEGQEFLEESIKSLDHWRIKENQFLDQFIIGQGLKNNIPYYNFRVYIQGPLRTHPFVKRHHLPFVPWFISVEDGQMCFIGEISVKNIPWESVPKYEKTLYLQHHCLESSRYALKYISMQTFHQESENKNPFRGQSENELRYFDQDGEALVHYFVKETHTALIPPQHIPFIFANGQIANLSFDKYTVDRNGDLVIYYP